jgi:hypothetical protein
MQITTQTTERQAGDAHLLEELAEGDRARLAVPVAVSISIPLLHTLRHTPSSMQHQWAPKHMNGE